MLNKFTVDAKTIIALGRNSVKDNTTALLELVKNSYDADSTKVEVEIITKGKDGGYIRIADNGKGMTVNEVESKWLRIGYSYKVIDTISELGRRKTGEKGVGRLAADRLGSLLTLITKNKDNTIVGIKIDWEDFNKENTDLSFVEIEELKNPSITIPTRADSQSEQGTEVIIHNLRGDEWTENDIDTLYQELSVLTPPFKNVEDFEIYFKNDVKDELNGKIGSPFFDASEIELTMKHERGNPNITFRVHDKYNSNENKTTEQVIPWKQLSQRVTSVFDKKISSELQCGSVRVKLLFYPRDISAIQGSGFKLTEFRDFLDINSGVKIYRDNIRVRPYGDPSDIRGDWLGLADRKNREPAGIARPTWRVASNQIVGAVYIGRDTNEELIDKTSREGIMEDNNAFKDLRAAVLGAIGVLETYRHNLYKKGVLAPKKKTPKEEVSNFEKSLSTFKSDLEGLEKGSKTTKEVLQQAEKVREETEGIKKVVEETYSQNKLLGGLATIGISSVVFGHETQSSIDQFILSTTTALKALEKKPPKLDIALSETKKASVYSQKVSAWGNFSLARVQKGKREVSAINLKSVLGYVLEQLFPVFSAADINITQELEEIEVTTYVMDIETIVINLLTNAYTACLQKRGERKVALILKRNKKEKTEGYEIIVSDSGPGVDADFTEMIWEPLFSTKKDSEGKEIGTGMGLAIVRSLVEEMKGTKTVTQDERLKGSRFTIWLPL